MDSLHSCRIRWDASVQDRAASANPEVSEGRRVTENQKLAYEERRQLKVKNDRAHQLNDLLKFSHTFKLHTPVPKEIVTLQNKGHAEQANDEATQPPTADIQMPAASSNCGRDRYCIRAQSEVGAIAVPMITNVVV